MDIEKRFSVRRAQALVELALGLFAISLVLAGLFAFLFYIVSSMDMSRSVRAEAGREAMGSQGMDGDFSSQVKSGTVKVSPMAAEYIFGSQEVEVREEVHMPNMKLAL